MKHAEIARCAADKLNSVHKKVSEALRDGNISEDEFDRILAEETQYRPTKEELHSRATQTAEAERKKWNEEGQEAMRQELETIRFGFEVECSCFCRRNKSSNAETPPPHAFSVATAPPLDEIRLCRDDTVISTALLSSKFSPAESMSARQAR